MRRVQIRQRIIPCALALALTSALGSGPARSRPSQASQARPAADYSSLPMRFEANRGQTDSRVKFLTRGSGYNLFLTASEAVFSFFPPGPSSAPAGNNGKQVTSRNARVATLDPGVLRMTLAGSQGAAQIEGQGELSGWVNYLIGKDPKQWRTKIPTYGSVRYRHVYPGIDLIYRGSPHQLEYDFIVAPGADPKSIRLAFAGADNLDLDAQGRLVLHMTGRGKLLQHAPDIYQEIDGIKQRIPGRYVWLKTGDSKSPTGDLLIAQKDRKGTPRTFDVSFELGAYDITRPLVIDPVLSYSTYLGGSQMDLGTGIAMGPDGSTYVTGTTESLDFPLRNALQPTYGEGYWDAFVTKLSSDGSALLYSTYLGGSAPDLGGDIAVDASGHAYVTGMTWSMNFPTANAFQPASGGLDDAFVAKLNPDGSALVYSTYLGGSFNDQGDGIAVDAAGGVFVTGRTTGPNFPLVNPLQPARGGGYDAFVARINPEGSALVYSTYLGGVNRDGAEAIAVDAGGNASVSGWTESSNFPTANALQPTFRGGESCRYTPYHALCPDAFVAKLTSDGSRLVYSTFLGGSNEEEARDIAVDADGNAHVVGYTYSSDFPRANAFQPTFQNRVCEESGPPPVIQIFCPDAFIAKIRPDGSALLYSTFLGGRDADGGEGVAVDRAGNAFLTGFTGSSNFPIMNPLQPLPGTGAFVTKLIADGSMLGFSTYLGPGRGISIASDGSANIVVTGLSGSPDFPTVNALQPTLGGLLDAFVAKISECAADATRSVALSFRGFQFHHATSRYMQKVNVENLSDQPLSGPVSIMLDNLSGNAALFNASGVATCAGSSRSPYINLNLGDDDVLGLREAASVVLEFTNPTHEAITYSARVLTGGGVR